MASVGMLYHGRIRPEGLEEYRRLHGAVWPELIALYRRAGIRRVRCFLEGCDLYVYSEVDPAVYPASRAMIDNDPVEQRWQALMRPLADGGFKGCLAEEVFDSGEADD